MKKKKTKLKELVAEYIDGKIIIVIIIGLVLIIGTYVYNNGLFRDIEATKIVSSEDEFKTIRNYYGDTFKDVESNEWYADSVKFVFERDIMSGYVNSTFMPYGSITDAEVIKLASEIHSKKFNNDISSGHFSTWYEPYVNYAIANNILPSNYNEKNLNNFSSREFVIYMFGMGFSLEDLEILNDINLSDYNMIEDEYKETVKLFCNAGIITGRGNNEFDPKSNITRSEVATIITRLLDKTKRVGFDIK